MATDLELRRIPTGRTLSDAFPTHRSKEDLVRGEIGMAEPGLGEQDETLLARLGKRQVLKRNFDFVSMFAFTCMVLISWEGFYQIFTVATAIDGGPGSVIYGFLVIFIGTVSTFVSIGELASIAPTAGGQYHWVYMLGPARSRKVLSYLTGWMTVVSWQATAASVMYTAGTIFEGLIILNHPTYEHFPWRVVFYSWIFILLALVANTIGLMLLPIMECAFLIVHVLGFVAVFIIVCYLAPHGDARDVFASFNLGDWPTQGVSAIVGFASLVYVFLGADAAVHMSEEIHNASVNVPRSMLISVLVNGLLGFAVVVPTVFGFVAVDMDLVISTDTGYPFIALFAMFTGNNVGGTVVCSIILAMIASCLIGLVTTTSRMIWAFARDRGLPFSDHLSKIDKRTSGPLNAVLASTAISALLSLVSQGPSIVFSSLVSLGVAGFYSTYLASITLLLWHRICGSIKEPFQVNDDGSAVIHVHSGRLTWGPWRVRGWLGTANNLFACLYLLFIIFFSLWPSSNEPTAKGMDYSVVILFGVLVFSLCYYALSARYRYSGPVVEVVI